MQNQQKDAPVTMTDTQSLHSWYSSQTEGRTQAPVVASWSPNHWATRAVPRSTF